MTQHVNNQVCITHTFVFLNLWITQPPSRTKSFHIKTNVFGFSFPNQTDFLPFKCDLCHKTYCLDHRSAKDHRCPHASIKDNQVSVCPLCEKPVSISKGQDPNQIIEKHISNGCKSNPEERIYKNHCTFKNCKQSELIPINCKQCKHQFCLKHRAPLDHQCSHSNANRQHQHHRTIGPFKIPLRVN